MNRLNFRVERIRKDAIGRWRELGLSQKPKYEGDQIPGCRAGTSSRISVQTVV